MYMGVNISLSHTVIPNHALPKIECGFPRTKSRSWIEHCRYIPFSITALTNVLQCFWAKHT